MKSLSEAFEIIFSDDDWFNKVLVGGLYIFLVLCGFGIILINGYIVEYMQLLLKGNKHLPFWRDFPSIIKIGWKVSVALILYYGTVTFIFYLYGIPIISLELAWTYFFLHVTIHPLVLLAYAQSPRFSSCFNMKNIFRPLIYGGKQIGLVLTLSSILLLLSITVGWMAIIVGWTLLIFLSLLVQNASFALVAKSHFDSHS
jgi:hypothetical protein